MLLLAYLKMFYYSLRRLLVTLLILLVSVSVDVRPLEKYFSSSLSSMILMLQ